MKPTRILATKLYPPPHRSSLVSRPRLVERLRSGLQPGQQLILISAAAGFGKTTLASEWIAEDHLAESIVWISLDEEDNDPARFLIYLIAALQQVVPAFGENILSVLQSSQEPHLVPLVDQLINQLAVSNTRVLLFLDDYHLITSGNVHQVMHQLIERQPASMRIVILTREDPPFPLPRMRVRGQLKEIRERDLRFTLAEAKSFLVEAMGLDLSSEEVGKLKERTEGWAAGMQLAALALEDFLGEADRRVFIDAFTGSDRYIVDYLVSEVLDRQTGPVREFLLNTSLLERFCADLCDHVVYGHIGDGRSQAILDSLEQGNMFLVPLDNQRQWYRYHHLFAEMLAHSLRRTTPDMIPALHRRTCEWLEARGFISEAVKYALQYASEGGNWDFAGAMIARYAMRMILLGQENMVTGWCQAFPRAYLDRSPEICIYYAWALVLTFRTDYLDAVEEKLQWAVQALETRGIPEQAPVGQDGSLVAVREWVTGQVSVVRSQILLGRFYADWDPQELINLSLTGLDLLPQTEGAVRAICRINLAHAQLMQNNAEGAQTALEEALPFMLDAGNYLGGVTSIFYQARLAYYLGQLEQAEMLCRRWKEKFAALLGLSAADIPAIRGLDIVLSILLLERDQVEEAEQLLVQALDLPGWASWMELLGFLALARLRHLRGNDAGAEETLRRMANLGPQHASCAEALGVLFALRAAPDDAQVRARAEAWVKAFRPDPARPFALGIGPYHCDVEYFCNLAWGQTQIALGRSAEALMFLEPALSSARAQQLPLRALELSLTLALAYEASGRMAAALAELESALRTAERFGYVRVFSETPAVSRLLQKVIERRPGDRFAQQMLAVSAQRMQPARAPEASVQRETPRDAAQAALVEPLSERELQVLRLIEAGYSNAQIAQRLVIAPGTVKRHITNLYGKLDVQSRTQAIAKARAIGLI